MLNSITTKTVIIFLVSLSLVSSFLAAPLNLLPSPDALALLSFKSAADPHNHLHFPSHFPHCQWQGVKCAQGGQLVRFVVEGLPLGGSFPPKSLARLDQLRVLSLQNNSLTGPIPDLSSLTNLKTLFLDHNSFSSSFPPSILSLHRLLTLDLSHNNLTGPIPIGLITLDRLNSLRLESNHFNGSIPPFNQTSLQVLNISHNRLSGAIPVTPVLSRFDISSFSSNPGLCGKLIHQQCHPVIPFFHSSSPLPSPPSLNNLQGLLLPPPVSTTSSPTPNKKTHMIIGFSVSFCILGSFLMVFIVLFMMKKKKRKGKLLDPSGVVSDSGSVAVMRIEEENELELKVKKMQGIQLAKSGCLIFCAGEAHVYSLDQLMTASAEMLGRGSIGTTYKAVLDNQLIVTVKRLDAVKTGKTSREVYERHLESVGSLRHPNLVPLRAYFQAKEERLIIYDYQPNGSLFNLIHGSRSARAKPLHWTSCLKIAEDVAQGLAYIHQASRLVHGNLKSSNILLGADFEACLTDYCLAVLSESPHDDADSAGYWAPETRRSSTRVSTKSDVYSFGVLLLELLTGKAPSQHPFLAPTELSNWVRSVREVESGEENRLSMLLEVAITCSLVSPEQRPTMWQVLKMIQEIKEAVMMEDNEYVSSTGFS